MDMEKVERKEVEVEVEVDDDGRVRTGTRQSVDSALAPSSSLLPAYIISSSSVVSDFLSPFIHHLSAVVNTVPPCFRSRSPPCPRTDET